MGTLEVPGARLYYETHGSGPLLLMVPGGSGNGDPFRPLTRHLSARYTVAIYDRRGFPRSQLTRSQDYDQRLEPDADDVRRLIEHLRNDPATVFGGSSGAIVALDVLARHPSLVRTLVAREPPAVKLLPDGHQWLDFFAEVYERYRRSGIEPTLATFGERAFAESDRQTMARGPTSEYTLPNTTYWFEHELRQYPAVDLDLDALKARADRIVLTAGRDSRGTPSHRVSVQSAKKIGWRCVSCPAVTSDC